MDQKSGSGIFGAPVSLSRNGKKHALRSARACPLATHSGAGCIYLFILVGYLYSFLPFKVSQKASQYRNATVSPVSNFILHSSICITFYLSICDSILIHACSHQSSDPIHSLLVFCYTASRSVAFGNTTPWQCLHSMCVQ
jgi:hypothetical protein